MVDSKFDKLLHLNNTWGMSLDDWKALLPAVLDLLEINLDSLSTDDRTDLIFDKLKEAKRKEFARINPTSNQSAVADDKSTLIQNAEALLKKLKQESVLEDELKSIYESHITSDYDDSGSDTTTSADEKEEEQVEINPTEAFYQSEEILKEHGEEKFPFTKHGIEVYKPRERGTRETDEEYVAYLKNYYETLFGKFDAMDKAESKVQDIQTQIDDATKARDEALAKVNELKDKLSNLYTPENMTTKSPEELAKEAAKLQEDLNKAAQNYRFYVEKLKDLNKNLDKAKTQNVPLLTDGRGNVPLLTDGRQNVVDDTHTDGKTPQPLLPDGKKNVPLLTDGQRDVPKLPPHVEPNPPVPPVPPVPPEPTEEEITEEITDEVTEEHREPEKKGRRLEVILNELIKGLGIQAKDNKTYNLSNIQVSGTMKAKLKQGNYIYNTVAALNIGTYLSIPINFIKKVAGKIRMTPKAKNRIETLKSRINSLSEEDLMVIYKEYRADRAGQNRDFDLVNTLLGERIGRFVNEKVAQINAKITELYHIIVSDFQKISALMPKLEAAKTEEEKAAVEAEADKLFAGKCELIEEIEKLQKEGREWYSGGAHGFEEDMKAAKTKMTFIGKRFSKSKNTNEKLSEEEATLVSELDSALAARDDERALAAFLKREKLLSDNTVIKKSIFGKRSVGDRYYEPLVTKMDYRNDPFVQDLMGAVATMGGIINIVGSVKNAAAVKAQTDAANAQIDAANQARSQAEAQIHGYGEKIGEHSETVLKGQQAQSVENELAHMNTAERYTLDATDWGLGTDSYRAMDNATHAAYNQRYAEIQSEVNNIAGNYASGAMGVTDALRSMESVARTQQQGFIDMLSQYQPTLIDYAATHPQFDLTGLCDSVNYMISNPNAIGNMYAAQASISEIGRQLQQITLGGDIQGIQIATTIWPQIVGTGSAYILATNVANQMKANSINGKYGNEVIDMIKGLDEEALEGISR